MKLMAPGRAARAAKRSLRPLAAVVLGYVLLACSGETRPSGANGGTAGNAGIVGDGGTAQGGASNGGGAGVPSGSGGALIAGGAGESAGGSSNIGTGGVSASGASGTSGEQAGAGSGGTGAFGCVPPSPPPSDPRCGTSNTMRPACGASDLFTCGYAPVSGPNPCNGIPPFTEACCGGYWVSNGQTLPAEELCPVLRAGQDPTCPEPIITSSDCTESLLCEYDGPISPRRCCGGSWTEVWCGGGASAEQCECAPEPGTGARSCVDVPDDGTTGAFDCGIPNCIDGRSIYPIVSDEPLPEGSGGEIVYGTYALTALVIHENLGCFPIAGTSVSQTLRLAEGRGWLVDWSESVLLRVLFTFSTSGASISMSETCPLLSGVTATRAIDTYASYEATGDHFELFDPSCGYRAIFQRFSP